MSKAKTITEGLAPSKKSNFGMNTMKSSSIALFSYYQYSNAYELDDSSHVIIKIYVRAYSLCVMILTCRTSCLIIHITYMSRIRAKLRWWFIVPLGVPLSYGCQLVGSKSREDVGSFFVHKHGARVCGNR